MVERTKDGRLRVRPNPRKRMTAEAQPERPTVPRLPELPDVHGVTRNVDAMCTARRANGEPCRAYAVAGANVCYRHGGGAPQVQRVARVRLANRADWLVKRLLRVIESTDDERTHLNAILAAMDRAGLGKTEMMAIALETGSTRWEQTLAAATTIQRLAPQPEVIEAEPVEPGTPLPEPTVPVAFVPRVVESQPPRRPKERDSELGAGPPMLSQSDIQDGKRPPRGGLGNRNTRSEMRP